MAGTSYILIEMLMMSALY